MMYKLINIEYCGTATQSIVKDNGDGSFTAIPLVADNTDYQAYLKWIEEGNTPLLADE